MNTCEHFLYEVVRPTLMAMNMHSVSAEKLLIMIACHESMGFKHRKQVRGPALSYFQIEPATLSDVVDRYLLNRPKRRAKVEAFLPDDMTPLEALAKSDVFATAIARMRLAMIPAPLPHVSDDVGIAYYAKTYWNTYKGKATSEKYLGDFLVYGPELPPEEWV